MRLITSRQDSTSHACSIKLHALVCIQEAVIQRKIKRPGLGHVLEIVCGIPVDKSLAMSDWRVRPLTNEQLMYAVEDTRYLQYVAVTLLDWLNEPASSSLPVEESGQSSNSVEKPCTSAYGQATDSSVDGYLHAQISSTSSTVTVVGPSATGVASACNSDEVSLSSEQLCSDRESGARKLSQSVSRDGAVNAADGCEGKLPGDESAVSVEAESKSLRLAAVFKRSQKLALVVYGMSISRVNLELRCVVSFRVAILDGC
jgi:hypothetical protein